MLTVDFRRLHLPPGAVVLDLGCGDGRHARAARLLPGVGVVALDAGEKEAMAAAGSLRAMATGGAMLAEEPGAGAWLVLRGDACRLPFAAESFDCVIAAEILEHLHDDTRALAEIDRVLKPGGELVVSVPRFGPELICWLLSPAYRNSPGGHVRIYRRSQIVKRMARQGFELFDAHFAHALHTPYWWLKCAVGLDRSGGIVGLYHRFLVWEMMARPRVLRVLERLLDPLIGKSEVFYARKPDRMRELARRRRCAPLPTAPVAVPVARRGASLGGACPPC